VLYEQRICRLVGTLIDKIEDRTYRVTKRDMKHKLKWKWGSVGHSK